MGMIDRAILSCTRSIVMGSSGKSAGIRPILRHCSRLRS